MDDLESLAAKLDALKKELLPAHNAPPPALYHYTTPEGLIDILKSSRLWVTHAAYVNDSSELTYARDLIAKSLQLKKKQKNKMHTRIFLDRVNQAVFDLKQVDTYHNFIVCFCQNGDLLSQWRSYGSKGGGFAIGFDLSFQNGNMFFFAGSKTPSVLLKVVYTEAEQRRFLNNILDRSCDFLNALDSKMSEVELVEVLKKCFEAIFLPLYRALFSFKHKAFKEENEWRLVELPLLGGNIECLRFRAASNMIIPYVELACLDTKGQDIKLPIKEIICGPTLHPDLSAQSVGFMLRKQGYTDAVKIKSSRIPFRA